MNLWKWNPIILYMKEIIIIKIIMTMIVNVNDKEIKNNHFYLIIILI